MRGNSYICSAIINLKTDKLTTMPTYTYKYPRPAVTADMIVLTEEPEPKILLIQRGGEPFKGCWAFPGGFMEMDEKPMWLEFSKNSPLQASTMQPKPSGGPSMPSRH